MPSVDQEIVREYFEGNGFLVRPLRRPASDSKKKVFEEESELLVHNPAFRSGGRKPEFFLFASELESVQWAVVVVKSGPASRISPGVLKGGARLLRFIDQNAGDRTGVALPEGEGLESIEGILTVLVVPGLPTAEPYRSQVIELLRSRGIDGIISFRSMLLDIIGRLEPARGDRGSDLIDLIRVLKTYGLITNVQMELFG